MVSYKDAGKMLDKAMEALPEGIFDGLNGGVNLIEEAKTDSKGSHILGLYHNNMMGRYVEIFYGSFRELYGDIPPMQFERRLKSTLHHELTHHIESLAGDHALEDWDELQQLIWNEPEEAIFVGSILFVDDDDTALAPAAKALFRMYAAQRCPDIPAESAGLFSAGDFLHPDCRKAAEALGADFEGFECKELTEELFDSFDVVMCMTLAQLDEVLDRFPGSEMKLICADETDILRPKLKINWKKAVERLNAVMNDETEQLRLSEDSPQLNRVSEDGMNIVRINEDNTVTLERMAELEQAWFSAPWTERMLKNAAADPDNLFLAAMCGEMLMGYITARCAFGEVEIFNVLVDSPYRGQHMGEKLVRQLISLAREIEVEEKPERITLEVRESNAPAIGLYQKLGFVEVGRRKNYYEKPREDAILMDLNLS